MSDRICLKKQALVPPHLSSPPRGEGFGSPNLELTRSLLWTVTDRFTSSECQRFALRSERSVPDIGVSV
jgi:hypothetical protein